MEKCNYKRIDEEHNVYQCEACGHIVELEADGPFENGLDYCAHCGREIVHPFRCECGYTGELETISLLRPLRSCGSISFAEKIECPGLVCCPKCRTVKFCPPAPGRK